MKKFLALLLAAMMILSMAACTPETPDDDVIKLNIAYMPNWGALWAVATADEKGYFAEEGIEITLVPFENGPNEIAAMEEGSIDISYIGPGAHKLCSTGKAEVMLLQHLGDGDCIIGLKGITKLEDLRGKTVGYAAGTSSETILKVALESVGMTMDDIVAMNMNASNLTMAAISGEVDAVAAWAPSSLTILAQVEGAVDICSNVDFPSLVSPGSWVVNPTWADENSETMVKFARAMYKAMDYAAAATTDDAIANEVAGYISKIIAKDAAAVLEERYTGSWMSSTQLKEMLESGTVAKVYADQQATFIANGALEATGNLTPEQFVLLQIMKDAFGK